MDFFSWLGISCPESIGGESGHAGLAIEREVKMRERKWWGVEVLKS